MTTRTWRRTLAGFAVAAHCLLAQAASVAPVAAENGMVVTAQHLATRVGVDVLKDGGNAVDAAVAVGYALAVVYPAAGNLGGGGFMTIQLADGRKTFLDFREKAPLAAKPDMYLGPDGNVVKGLSTERAPGGRRAGHGVGARTRACEVRHDETRRADGACDPLRRGRLRARSGRRRLLVTATELPPGPRHARRSSSTRASRSRPASAWCRPTSRRRCVPSAREGADGFYKGAVGAAIVASSKAGKGIITQADLDQYTHARTGAGRVRLPRLRTSSRRRRRARAA